VAAELDPLACSPGRRPMLDLGPLRLSLNPPYHDLGVDWHPRRNDQAHTRRLVAQLERVGHRLNTGLSCSVESTPDAAACPVVGYTRSVWHTGSWNQLEVREAG
jgi:hypothetical protein